MLNIKADPKKILPMSFGDFLNYLKKIDTSKDPYRDMNHSVSIAKEEKIANPSIIPFLMQYHQQL